MHLQSSYRAGKALLTLSVTHFSFLFIFLIIFYILYTFFQFFWKWNWVKVQRFKYSVNSFESQSEGPALADIQPRLSLCIYFKNQKNRELANRSLCPTRHGITDSKKEKKTTHTQNKSSSETTTQKIIIWKTVRPADIHYKLRTRVCQNLVQYWQYLANTLLQSTSLFNNPLIFTSLYTTSQCTNFH